MKTLMIIYYLSQGVSTQIVTEKECKYAEEHEHVMSMDIDCIPLGSQF